MATKYRKVRAVNPAKKLAWNWRRTNVMQAFADAQRQGVGPAYNWKYAKEIRWLEREGLVQGSETTGYVLTPAGMAEARRRGMLPSSHLHNPSHGGITIEEQSVLEQLARDAEDSGDDWGISQGVADYLAQAYHNRATDPPDAFLQDLQGDVWWHYKHSGEGKESEGADPMYSEESAKRAEKLIGVARRKLSSYRDPLEPLRRAGRATTNPDETPLMLEIRWTDRDRPAQQIPVDWIEGTTAEELTLKDDPRVYEYGYHRMSADTLNEQLRERIERDFQLGYPAGGLVQIIETDGLDDQPSYRGMIVWSLVANDPDAQALIDEMAKASHKARTRASNPRFRYAAVPVEHNGHETAHVVRGKRRTDMVRSVARSVPGDAVVDLGRTRTFATKHEATAYAKRTSPAVRNGSRR